MPETPAKYNPHKKEQAITASRETTETVRKHESERDMPKVYGMYDEDISSFAESFEAVIPDKEKQGNQDMGLVRYLRQHFPHGVNVLFEAGGPASKLASTLRNHITIKESKGATLTDLRNPVAQLEDTSRHHSVVEGNIFDTTNNFGLETGSVDVFIERMGAAIQQEKGLDSPTVPQNIYAIADIASHWYSLLSERGVMFVQLPRIVAPILHGYIHMLQQHFPQQFEIQAGMTKGKNKWLMLRLQKLPGAPETLPMLTHRQIVSLLDQDNGSPRQIVEKWQGDILSTMQDDRIVNERDAWRRINDQATPFEDSLHGIRSLLGFKIRHSKQLSETDIRRFKQTFVQASQKANDENIRGEMHVLADNIPYLERILRGQDFY